MVEIIVAIVGVGVSVLTYYLGRRAGRRERDEDQRRDRIERVVSRYVAAATSGRDSGPHALIGAGIRELSDDGEYRTALAMIAGRLGRHPLGGTAEQLTRPDMKRFF